MTPSRQVEVEACRLRLKVEVEDRRVRRRIRGRSSVVCVLDLLDLEENGHDSSAWAGKSVREAPLRRKTRGPEKPTISFVRRYSQYSLLP